MRTAFSALILGAVLVHAIHTAQPSPDRALIWSDGPPLPAAVTNNAVAGASVNGRSVIFSFLGLGQGKDYRSIVRSAYRLDVRAGIWRRLPDVPGEHGRLAATAQAVGGRVYLFGGYLVASDGQETTSPAVDIFDSARKAWSSGAPMPVPLDDSVSGVWRDRLIYLVSGWSTRASVQDVLIYDPAADTWQAATPTPGPAVFGHAGGLVDDTIVYCDGAVPPERPGVKFMATAECYRGDINPDRPTRISWRRIEPHPGGSHYRMAAVGMRVGERPGVLFAAGTVNPYNYTGVGYDGQPSRPGRQSWFYDIGTDTWLDGPPLPAGSMDHRGLATVPDGWYLVGGMLDGQTVTARVVRLSAVH